MRQIRISKVAESDCPSKPRLRKALERVRPEMVVLKPPELLVVNVDPTTVTVIVRKALPNLLALRAQIANELIHFDLRQLDMLETYALALIQAQSVCSGIEDKSPDLKNLSSEANSLRARLLGDLKTLTNRGHVSPARLEKLHGPNGYRHIAGDLLIITNVLRDTWSSISGMIEISEQDLDRAESLADRILGIVGKRTQQTELSTVANEERQRAFTLLMRAYNEVRRAVTYLRWHEGDIAQLAPSVYCKSTRKRKKTQASAIQATESNQPSTSTPAIAISDNQSVGLTDVTTVNAVSTEAAPKSKTTKSAVRVGMPGADPFIH